MCKGKALENSSQFLRKKCYFLYHQVSPGQTKDMSTTTTKTKTNTYSSAKKNVLKTLVTVFGCFVLCWTCNQIFITMYFLGYPVNWNSAFYHFTVFATFSNCCLNPCIYALKYKEFQVGFKCFIAQLLPGKSFIPTDNEAITATTE
jgi:hypothetical protein